MSFNDIKALPCLTDKLIRPREVFNNELLKIFKFPRSIYNVAQGDDQAEQKTRMNEDGLAMV